MSQTYAVPRPQLPLLRRVLVGIILVAGLIALLQLTGALAQVRSIIPGMKSSTPTYQTSKVTTGNVGLSVTATGPISAATSIPLSFKESGKLLEIKVNVGDHVTKGQVLATLDTTDLQIALEQAKATLAQAQANLVKVQAGSTKQTVAVAQASVDNAKQNVSDANAGLAATKASNTQNLAAAQGSVAAAQTSLGNAQAALVATQNQAAKTLAADQLAVSNAQKSLDATRATVAADVPVIEQQVEQAKDNLWSTQVSRDAACGHGGGAQCDAANAQVAASQTAVNTAQSQLIYNQKQSAQQVSAAQATLATANAQLAKDQSGQQAAIVSAQNQVKQNEAALKTAQNGVNQAQANAAASIQSAQSSINNASNTQRSAEASYNETTAPPVQSDIDTAKAQVQNAQAAVNQAQNNLDSAVLTAPFAGTIASVNGSVDQWISGGTVAATSGSSASSTAIFTLMNLNELQVGAQVNEADISKVKVGDPVTFDVSAFPGQTFQGKVITIQPVGTTSSNVVVYNVTSSIQSTKDANLYPGMTATVTIVSAQHNNVVTVPNSALTFAQTAIRQGLIQKPTSAKTTGSSGPKASTPSTKAAAASTPSYVVTLTQGRMTLVPVTIGLSNGSISEVASGLKAGETIITGSSTGTASRTTSSTARSSSPLGGGGRPGP